MHAKEGDLIVLAGEQVDRPTRDGRVIEVRGADGGPPYMVEWSNGHTGLIYPGPGSVLRVISPEASAAEVPVARASSERSEHPTPVREWSMRISVFAGDETAATALLVTDAATEFRATGASRRNVHDPAQPIVGEEIAVARALRHLADQLLEQATQEIEASTHEQDVMLTPQ